MCRHTKLQMLLSAGQQLNESLRNVMLQDKELAAVMVLPYIEAQNIVQIAEDAIVQNSKLHLCPFFKVKKRLEESDGRVLVETGQE
jgi:hypothetical protein